jgi:putative DNA primase/helicase
MLTNLKGLPFLLKDYPNWVLWKLEPKPGEVKPAKIPYNPNDLSRRSSSTDPKTWGSFSDVEKIYNSSSEYSGVGFVFSPSDPFIGIDFDHCLIDGQVNSCAFLNTSLLDSYTEISQSGSGLHIVGVGDNPAPDGKGHKKGDIEFYTQGRFFALTGNIFKNFSEIKKISQIVLQPFYKKYFVEPPKPVVKKVYIQKDKGGKELSDERIIELCSNAKNSSKFTSLWRGSTSGYSSNSEADLALISILGFYTQDVNQLQRMLKGSGLARDKTDREDYLNRTIAKALSGMTETFGQETGICYFCKRPIGKTQIGEYHPYCGKRRVY